MFRHTLTFYSLTKDRSRAADLGQEGKEKEVLGHAVVCGWLEGETGDIQETEMSKGQSSLSPAPHPATPDCTLMDPAPESCLGLLVRDCVTLKLGSVPCC